MSSYYFARKLIYVLNHHNSLKEKIDQRHQLMAKLEILVTQKGQRELGRGGRENDSYDFPERYQWRESKEVMASINDIYMNISLLPFTFLT